MKRLPPQKKKKIHRYLPDILKKLRGWYLFDIVVGSSYEKLSFFFFSPTSERKIAKSM